ncbi:MAG: hypothetical protein ACJAU1_001773, partial [Psychromonas sp.]
NWQWMNKNKRIVLGNKGDRLTLSINIDQNKQNY